jgi:uncharacterized protein
VNAATGLLLFASAVLGSAINSVAGGGSFLTFPALLFAGVPSVPANATSTVALWPGTVASVFAYRHKLADVRRELVPMGMVSFLGGLLGSLLLLGTSDHTFVLLIPWLLLFATVLFSFGGAVTRRLQGRRVPMPLVLSAQFVVSIYGGYFGGGASIMILAILSVLGMTDIHRMNALKTTLGGLVNGVAVVAFIVARAVKWGPGLVMIAGGLTGGYAGAAVARRVKPLYVRRLVLGVAWAMTIYFFVKTYR